MKLAIRLPHGGPNGTTSASQIARLAKSADSFGLWGVTICDFRPNWPLEEWKHYPSLGVSLEAVPPSSKYVDFYDPLATFAYVSGITEHVKMIGCIFTLPVYHPILMAKWAATIDQFSNGRLILGVGLGGPGATFQSKYLNLTKPFGPNTAEAKVRSEMTDEYVLAMKELWTKDVSSFAGKYCNFENIEAFPKCVQKPHVPIWIGAIVRRPRGCRRTAELGEGIIPNLATPEDVTWTKAKIKEYAQKIGRPDFDPIVFCETWACVAKTREEAWRIANREMIEASMTGHIAVGVNESRVLIGTERDIINTLEAFKKVGTYGFELKCIYLDSDNLVQQAKAFAEIQKSFV